MSASDEELKVAKAALAPTLEATAAILPWVSKPREPKYPPEKAAIWDEAAARVIAAWSNRHQDHLDDFRPAVIALCAAALELADVDLLELSEAFASAADSLEDLARLGDPHLQAAVSAACECLSAEGGIEDDHFAANARQVSARVQQVLSTRNAPLRSPVIDQIFINEATECLDRMTEALEQLPADTYAVKLAAEDLALLADPLELETIAVLARALAQRLTPILGEHPDLDDPYLRAEVETRMTELGAWVVNIADDGQAKA